MAAPLDAPTTTRPALPDEERVLAEPRPGCDPLPPLDVPVPVPDDRAARCGDGSLGPYTAGCWRSEGGGGCGAPPPPGPVRCVEAIEVCDGTNLGGRTCKGLGFAGGRLACAPTCDAIDVGACVPCFARRGVRCDELAGVDRVEDVALGERAAALVWTERAGDLAALRLAIVRPAGIAVVAAPVVAWRTGEPAPEAIDVVALADGWVVLFLRDGRLWQRVHDRRGAALDGAREVAGGVRAVAADARDDRGARLAIVLGVAPAPPRLYRVGPRGLDREVAIERPVVGQLGERTAMLLPIPGAGPDQGDLAEITAGGGLTTWALFKQGREFGSSSGGATELDVTLIAGRLTMRPAGDRFVTTWRPVRGRPWIVERPAAPTLPAGLLASHPSVTVLRYLDGGRTRLALAAFAPPGGTPRLISALVH